MLNVTNKNDFCVSFMKKKMSYFLTDWDTFRYNKLDSGDE